MQNLVDYVIKKYQLKMDEVLVPRDEWSWAKRVHDISVRYKLDEIDLNEESDRDREYSQRL